VQLPRNWPISQAITQLAPAALGAAILAVFAWNRIRGLSASKRFAAPPGGEHARAGELWRWGISLFLAAVCTVITVLLVRYAWIIPVPANLPPPADGHEAMKGIFLRPWWNVALISLVLDTLCLRVALYIIAADLRRTKLLRSMPKDAFRVAVLAVFFTPIAASMVSAANSLPIAKLCGPAFSSPGSNGNYAIGSLIGINGQYAYLAEVLTENKDPKHFQFASGYVAVIPLSEANQISIGVNARCYQQAPPKKK
jgi:hypothetical protein